MHLPRSPWNTLSKKTVYNNPWIEIEEHTVINASDKEGIYGVVKFKNYAIGILPLDDEGNIWLIGSTAIHLMNLHGKFLKVEEHSILIHSNPQSVNCLRKPD